MPATLLWTVIAMISSMTRVEALGGRGSRIEFLRWQYYGYVEAQVQEGPGKPVLYLSQIIPYCEHALSRTNDLTRDARDELRGKLPRLYGTSSAKLNSVEFSGGFTTRADAKVSADRWRRDAAFSRVVEFESAMDARYENAADCH